MTGAEIIAAERQRQIDVEGWTAEHDNGHNAGELAAAAECYVALASDQEGGTLMRNPAIPPFSWPWDASWWKPSQDPERNLAKAGALIAAEIDRIRRRSNANQAHAG